MLAMDRVRLRAAGAAVLLLLLAAATACSSSTGAVVVGRAQVTPSICATYRARAADRLATVTGSGQRVVVIGDSWSVGRGLVGPELPWPAELHGQVHVDGFPGSGFAERDMAKCGRVSFADRAPNALRDGASLVVVEGGLNDVHRSVASVTAGFDRLMAELAGDPTVVIGPPKAPKRGDSVVPVDALLRRLCAQVGVPYISTLDVKLDYLRDGLHPTAEGHVVFGTLVAKRISRVVPAAPNGLGS